MQTKTENVGIYKLRLPVKYFNKNASKEDQEIYDTYKKHVEEIIEKGVGVVCFPAVRDDNDNPLFDLEFVG